VADVSDQEKFRVCSSYLRRQDFQRGRLTKFISPDGHNVSTSGWVGYFNVDGTIPSITINLPDHLVADEVGKGNPSASRIHSNYSVAQYAFFQR